MNNLEKSRRRIKMTKLELAIQMAANAYYKDGSSQYTDEEFDEMMEELRETQPDSELLKDGVQEELKGVSKKYKLEHTMGTLAKCMDEDSFRKMWNTHCKGKDVVIQKKIDGCLDKDTILQTDIGDKTISEIVENKIKCNVKAYDFESNKEIYTPVLDWYINNNDFEWYEIELEDGKKIKATSNHKFYLPELRCWREVDKLTIGDELKID